ncbi:MAG: ankyrin repeat domain-containing protein [Bacteroidales bacterium]|nr:ankyrin repeat domain-containing protein [Bacteroidales bacterium]
MKFTFIKDCILLILVFSFTEIYSQKKTFKFYDGDQLPPEKVAVLTQAEVYLKSIYINNIDGEKVDIKLDRIELLPGNHSMDIRYQYTDWGGTTYKGWGNIDFNFEPKKCYTLDCNPYVGECYVRESDISNCLTFGEYIIKESPYQQQEKLNSELFFASYQSRTKEIVNLLESGADINTKNHYGWTPLLLAIKTNTIKNADILLQKGAEVNVINYYKYTPLMYAIENKQSELAKTLIEMNAEINIANDNGKTPLMIALETKQPEIAEILMKKGANIHFTDNDLYTPLMYAIMNTQYDIAEALVENGADLNAVAEFLIMYKIETVSGEHGDTINRTAVLVGTWTPLLLAIEYKQKKSAILLLEKGAIINVENLAGPDPLVLALEKKQFKIAEMLIEKGADLTRTDKNGYTPLMLAITKEEPELAISLINKGADIENISKDGKNALSLAREKEYYEMVNLMSEKLKKKKNE